MYSISKISDINTYNNRDQNFLNTYSDLYYLFINLMYNMMENICTEIMRIILIRISYYSVLNMICLKITRTI